MTIYDINGNILSSGGVSSEITPEMTTFIEEEKSLKNTEKNLLFGAKWTDGKIWNNGSLFSSSSGACTTELIPVVAGNVYIKTKDGAGNASGTHACFFDSDKNGQGNMNWTKVDGFYKITVPDNASYMGFNSKIAVRDSEFMFTIEDYAEYLSKGTEDKYIIDNLNVAPKDLPVLYLIGDITNMSKEKKVELEYRYVVKGERREKTGWCTAKWQGDSSLGRDKKNYTVVFYNDPYFGRKEKIEFMDGIKQSKWVAKAYYDDPSRFKNNLGARLWGQIVKQRPNIPDELVDSPNYGAIDGYPILLYINDEFVGLYMFNVPKDDFTFGMDSKNPLHCVAYGDSKGGTNEACSFRSTNVDTWSNEVPEVWTESTEGGLVNLINFVMTSTDEDFKANLNTYLEVDSALEYYCMAYLLCMSDSLANNLILLTYDGGVKWHCSMYDMDSMLGTGAWGTSFAYNTQYPEGVGGSDSLLWERIESVFAQELYDKYKFLRSNVLSIENIEKEMTIFTEDIGDANYFKEYMKWGNGVNQLDKLKEFIEKRAEYVDAEFEAFNTTN